jgi:hypothetical protein
MGLTDDTQQTCGALHGVTDDVVATRRNDDVVTGA